MGVHSCPSDDSLVATTSDQRHFRRTLYDVRQNIPGMNEHSFHELCLLTYVKCMIPFVQWNVFRDFLSVHDILSSPNEH
jgi:hypothetical protein